MRTLMTRIWGLLAAWLFTRLSVEHALEMAALKADLYRQAAVYEAGGLPDLAADLRLQAAQLSAEGAVGQVHTLGSLLEFPCATAAAIPTLEKGAAPPVSAPLSPDAGPAAPRKRVAK